LLTFLHAADFHLDSPFRSLSPDQASERRQEQRQLLTRLAEAVTESRADLLFLSGDLFDGQRARPETLQILYHILEELETEVFLSPGNHDPWTPGSPYGRLTWPNHVHIFSTRAPARIVLPRLNAVVYGSAFTSLSRTDGPLEGFRVSPEDQGMACFGCFHGELAAASRYGPVTTSQIASSGLDYLALGHIHTASGLQRAGKTWYAWPGCPEGRGFDETGDKGVYVGTLDNGQVTLEFLPLARRRYLSPKLDITGKDPVRALQDLMARSEPRDILRVTLTGERDEESEPDLTELTALASGYFYSASVIDQTVLSKSLWSRMEEDTLTGLFLREMRRRLDEAGDEDKPTLERAIRFGLAALEGREEPK
jgi:DNA repair exonuclease SbcCD nuclease subunit